MERGMKGEVGALVSRMEKTGRRDSECSEGMELISFNTHTSSYIRIITDLINAVYREEVAECVLVQMTAHCVFICSHMCL